MLPLRGRRAGRLLAGLAIVRFTVACETSDVIAPDDLDAPPGSADLSPASDLAPSVDVAMGTVCDPFHQTFCPPGSKCTVLREENQPPRQVCVAITGSRQVGERCARVDGTPGMDDCAVGLFCSPIGTLRAGAPFGGYCRPFCKGDGDCPGLTERCFALHTASAVGQCAPACTVFSTDCPAGLSCTYPISLLDDTLALSCAEFGAAGIGDPCTTQFECPANSVCWLPGLADAKCLAYCDAMHPCAGGQCLRDRSLLGWGNYTCQ